MKDKKKAVVIGFLDIVWFVAATQWHCDPVDHRVLDSVDEIVACMNISQLVRAPDLNRTFILVEQMEPIVGLEDLKNNIVASSSIFIPKFAILALTWYVNSVRLMPSSDSVLFFTDFLVSIRPTLDEKI